MMQEMTDIYFKSYLISWGFENIMTDLLVLSGVSGRYSSINLVSMEIFIFGVTGTFQVGEIFYI
jgi:hypothetical protein